VHIRFVAGLPAEVRRLRKFIRTEGIDIVQIGGLVNPHAAIAARLERVPIVWQLLDTRAPRPVAMAAMAWVRELADVVMSTGVAVAEAHPGYPAIADRVIPFFPPVELERFTPHPELRAEVRSAWGIPETALVVGCVANINPQKGIIELVHAFARARSGQVDTRLVLVGAEYSSHADYSAAVRAQMVIQRLVEGEDVVFVGERDDVERQLAGMDIVALAARPRSEGITTAILEGMAAGLPVVVTDVGALREAVADGRTGFVVPPDDTNAFAGALARLLGDRALRQQMGQEARRVAEGRFSVDTCADTHVRAYAQALARHGKAALVSRLQVGRLGTEPSAVGRVVDGIRVFVDDPGQLAHDELGHHHAHGHKAAQAAHFDRPGEEAFEIDRPHGTPRLYRFLLAEKFRRAVGPIRPHLLGASALTVCGGSGMDAEFLARAGATVISSDLSLGAATRAKARSERYGLEIRSIVADVEHLPFADQSVDLVAVHDGLHHLDDPYAGLSEMARVARRWVVVTEPARASITRLAIRLRLALETEEAGNRVARMEPSEVAAFLEARGYMVLRAERYAMYYPHRPGAVFSLLSRPFVFPLVRVGWRLANTLLGRFGNKMVVVAERAEAASAGGQSPSTPSPTRSTT
jgi:glycosyltransferase involved in cell wall biosynthesis/SAM-dependent methyltransferase